MATGQIPPAPIRDPWGSYTWEEWFRKLRDRATESLVSIDWTGINFTSSSLTDILDRKHNDLTNIQGGTSGEYYHLTAAQQSSIAASIAVTSVATSGNLSTSFRTYRVTASGTTQTLPAASSSLIGLNWTIVLEVDGYVTVAPAGSNTILLPTDDTTITFYGKGSSLTFRCLTNSTWGIV